MNRKSIILIIIFVILVIAAAVTAFVFTRHKKPSESDQTFTVLEEGSTPPNPDYFTTPEGKIIYNADPSGKNEAHDEKFPPVMAGAQRIYPADEDPNQRESYLTRAALPDIVKFYESYLDVRQTDYAKQATFADNFAVVQKIEMRGKDGRKQAAIYVNKDEGPRGGLKVLLKEFPEQNAVEIILTNVDAKVPGIDPNGQYVSPEQVQKWAKEDAARKAAEEEKRKETESQTKNKDANPPATGN
jgi:hypothetical protein